jgi:hypothetical protein
MQSFFRLTELIDKPINEQNIFISPREGIVEEMKGQKRSQKKRRDAIYEDEVFNSLFEKMKTLGISHVFRFRNMTIDGGIELEDRRFVAIEVKYRINWMKACQVGWQFQQFMKTKGIIKHPVKAGIIIFEEFSGDWARKAHKRSYENGWYHWYSGHYEIKGPYTLKVDLLRYVNGRFVPRPEQL